MYNFGKASQTKLDSCHPLLQSLMNSLILRMNVTIICGTRNREEQEKAYSSGASKARYGQSPHNKTPSMAVDVAPWPIDWNDTDRFQEMVDLIKELADELGIPITCGADFKSFKDYPHIELLGWNQGW